MDMKDSVILTVAEAADFTRLRVSTIYRYVQARRIPFLKVGSRVLFEREALGNWLAAHRVDPATRPAPRKAPAPSMRLSTAAAG